jgi:hypothetical protein
MAFFAVYGNAPLSHFNGKLYGYRTYYLLRETEVRALVDSSILTDITKKAT